jgi:GrpB-like predicted nucleotidyltransferase (UPF0157 family)
MVTIKVDEPIEVVSFDPDWEQRFIEEASRLGSRLAGQVVRIEHFGGTSVAGMAGKPIIDLLIGVEDMEQAYRVAEEVARAGYENLGEVLWPGRVYLRRRGPPHFNAVIVVHDGDLWKYFTTLRDYLRSHPAEVAAYSKAKREAVVTGAVNFLSYSQEKGPFLKGLSERALRWKFANRSEAVTDGRNRG